MNVQSFSIEVPKTARYFLSSSNHQSVKNLWFVLHGYSHLASDFIRQFEGIADPENLIVAPEGLSRFYVKGYFGNVGASWMTKVERMTDINDYIRYLDLVYEEVLRQLPCTPEKVIVLGYSQGGAAAARWAVMTNKKIDHLIVHSSEFPHDLDETLVREFSERAAIRYVYSDKDEFIEEELFEQQMQRLRSHQVRFTPLRFKGRHEIKEEVIRNLKQSVAG
jgi:predicted esterase